MKERNNWSKTSQRADKIRQNLDWLVKIKKIDLGVWTPQTLSNRAVIKMFSHIISKDYEKRVLVDE